MSSLGATGQIHRKHLWESRSSFGRLLLYYSSKRMARRQGRGDISHLASPRRLLGEWRRRG